jgi:hypothetical protein
MALQQGTNESVPPELVSVAGVDNALADMSKLALVDNKRKRTTISD